MGADPRAGTPSEGVAPAQLTPAKHYSPFEALLAKEGRDVAWAPAEEKVLLATFQSGLPDVETVDVFCAATACRVRTRGTGKSDAGARDMVFALDTQVLARRFVGFQRFENEETVFHVSRLGYTVPYPDGTPHPVVLLAAPEDL